MEHQGIEVGFAINGIEAGMNPTEYAMSISDSIHKSFPEFNLNLIDPTGLLMEKGVFLIGNDVEANVTIDDKYLQPKFRISRTETQSNPTAGQLSGKLPILAIHPGFFLLEDKPTIHSDTVSAIVSKLYKDLFDSVEVEATKGKGKFIQLEDPEEFLREILLPNALSSNDKKTPYFAFGSLDGKFHFKSLSKLLSQSPVAKLTLSSLSGQETLKGVLTGFLPFTEDMGIVAEFMSSNLSYLTNKEVKSLTGKVSDGASDKIPFVGKNKQSVEDWLGLQINPDIDYESFSQAQLYAMRKNAYLIERALVFTAEDPALISGQTVDLKIVLSSSEKEEEESEYYAGKWLIERSVHAWNGVSGTTQLVITRPSVKPVTKSILTDKAYK